MSDQSWMVQFHPQVPEEKGKEKNIITLPALSLLFLSGYCLQIETSGDQELHQKTNMWEEQSVEYALL